MTTKDPKKIHPQPPYSGKKVRPPGHEKDMNPTADHGALSYRGTGQLKGRRALITGADSGISRRLVGEAGRKAVLLPGDIGRPSVCKNVAKRAIKALGGICCRLGDEDVSSVPD